MAGRQLLDRQQRGIVRSLAAVVGVLAPLYAAPSAIADPGDSNAGGSAGASYFNAWLEEHQASETSSAAETAAGSASQVEYILDPQCVRGDGIAGPNAFYGCAGAATCGNDGTLYNVWAQLPDGTTNLQPQQCIEPGDPVAAASAPVLTPGRILEAFRRIPLPEAPLEVQPPGGETLVNFDTILHTQAEPFTETVQLLGRQVTFDISPASFTWSLGTGETMTTTDPGRPWARGVPMDQYVSHRYTEAGPVTLDLTTTWGARWRLGDGPWRDVDGTVTMTSPAQDLQVRTAQPQLVSYD